jgi:predicted MPP superfamily phosphohydrolase
MAELPRIRIIKHDLGLKTEAVYIIPLSDLHIGSDFDEDKFLGYRQWILDRPNAFCVINGDVLDMATKNSIGGQYETIRPREQRQLAVKYLEPLAKAGKILAYLDGNHEARASKDTDEYAGETICTMMGIPSVYDSDGIFLFLSVGHDRKKGEKNRNVYTMFLLHGYAGGRRVGARANALEDMSKIVMADVYLSAHTHQKLVFSKRLIVPDARSKTIKYKKQMYVSTGSFLEYSGYAVRKGYSPATLGSPRIRLSGIAHDCHVSV